MLISFSVVWRLQRRWVRRCRHLFPSLAHGHERTESSLQKVTWRSSQDHSIDKHRRNVNHHRRCRFRRWHWKDQHDQFWSGKKYDYPEAWVGVQVKCQATRGTCGASPWGYLLPSFHSGERKEVSHRAWGEFVKKYKVLNWLNILKCSIICARLMQLLHHVSLFWIEVSSIITRVW